MFLNRTTALAAMIMFSLLLPSLSHSKEEMSHHCKKDIEKYCEGVKTGKGRVWHCLRDHESDLSDECRTHMAKAKAKHEACKDDIDKFCSAKKGHHKKVHKCLKKHKEELSVDCKAAHPKWY